MTVARQIPTTQNPDLTTYTILVEGTEISREVSVLEIEVVSEINRIPSLSITISDGDPSAETFAQSDEEVFVPGNAIEVKLGYHSDNKPVFKGMITGISNHISDKKTSLVITAKATAVKATISKKNKIYRESTFSQIVEEILDAYNLEHEVEQTSESIEQLTQYWLSDWDFVLTQCNRQGFVVSIANDKVTVKKPELTGEKVLEVLFPSTILSYDAEIDNRLQWKGIEARAWDRKNMELIKVTANEPSWNEPGNITVTDIADKITSEAQETLVAPTISEEAELQKFADAKLMYQRVAKIKGNVSFQGYPEIFAGNILGLNGVGARFNGPVFVKCVRHTVEKERFITRVCFGMEPCWFAEKFNPYDSLSSQGILRTVEGLQIGIVTDLEDPLNEFRVKVNLPVIEDNAGDAGVWARIASLDAGNTRGFYFMPDVGDEVICGCIGGDIQNLVVLGMLYSATNAANETPSNDNNLKSYTSREKMKLTFDDENKMITVETPGSLKIVMDDTNKKIEITDANKNSILMDADGITIDSYKNLTLKAAAKVSAEAPQINVEGSGQTVIKGGVIQLN